MEGTPKYANKSSYYSSRHSASGLFDRCVLLIDELAGRLRQNAERANTEEPSQVMEVMVAEEMLASVFD